MAKKGITIEGFLSIMLQEFIREVCYGGNSRIIIGRNPKMVIPLLANQDLTPMLLVSKQISEILWLLVFVSNWYFIEIRFYFFI